MRKFFMMVRLAVIEIMAYRVDTFLYLASGIISPVIMLTIWLTIDSYGGRLPMEKTILVNYFLILMVVEIANSAWSSQFVSADIRYGRLSKYLIKPFSYFMQYGGQNIGEKVLKFIYLLPLVFIMGIIFQARPVEEFSVTTLLLFITSWILSALLMFLVDFIMGLASFWLQDSNSLSELHDVLYFIFSGRIVPIVALPSVAQQISFILPFRYMLSFPVEIITGKMTVVEISSGLSMQILWLTVTVILYYFVWTKGLKRYSAVGA